MKDFVQTAKEAAVIGGHILKENFRKIKNDDVEYKAKKDFVTYVDRLSEERIKDFILSKHPNHSFFGEEEGISGNKNSVYRWIVDPLDGTKNYINGFEIFAVSVALEENGEIVAGAIYIPILDKLYWAGKGQGAYVNGNQMRVSDRPTDRAIITTGFPFRYEEEIDNYLKAFREAMITFSAVRRPGAAAVDLAMTAEGVFDGFFEMKLSKWDIAAGSLMVEEAGGVFTNFQGKKELDGNVVAGGERIYKILFDIVQRTLV
ncbi:MAG: inositol monophosphatase [Aquificae bacterium]|nr:inositol monophosphatase [Aquificota bacterium]